MSNKTKIFYLTEELERTQRQLRDLMVLLMNYFGKEKRTEVKKYTFNDELKNILPRYAYKW